MTAERLTARDEKFGTAYFPQCFEEPCLGMGCMKEECMFKYAVAERLAKYEDLEEQGKLIKLPCAVGDILYTNFAVQGWYFREKNKPYEIKVVFIGVNGVDNFINVAYENGNTLQFNFSDIGKRIFLTREEAKKKLEEMKVKANGNNS